MSQEDLLKPPPSGKTLSILSRLPAFYRQEFAAGLLGEFVDTFGQILEQAETDLLAVLHSHFVDTATNKGSQGLNTAKKGDLDKIFALYLESLGGTSQLRQGKLDDDTYRRRMRSLISVIKNGASTREGILEIVAANLGIMGDSPTAKAARSLIRLEEFAPEKVVSNVYKLAMPDNFTLQNLGMLPTTPELRLRVSEELRVPLLNPRLINLTTGEFIQYRGTALQGSTLVFLSNSAVFLGGVRIPPQNILGQMPVLPPGGSRWRFEAELGVAAGYFDQSFYDSSLYERDGLEEDEQFDLPTGLFDEATFDETSYDEVEDTTNMAIGYFDEATFNNAVFKIDPHTVGRFDATDAGFDEIIFPMTEVVELHAVITKLTPGTFTVRVPWNIPGVTDNYDASETDPRNQIGYIIERVKAAGVRAEIAYEQLFQENQDLRDALKIDGSLQLPEIHDSQEANFDIGGNETNVIVHDMTDVFALENIFDVTRFDYTAFPQWDNLRRGTEVHEMIDNFMVEVICDVTTLDYSAFAD